MLKIVIIRSGSTDYDQQGRIQGTLDVPLSDQGREEITSAIESLRNEDIEILYRSRCEAAEQSAVAIGEALGIKAKVVDNLQNLDQGLWQGMLVDDVKTKQPKVYRQWQDCPENVCPPRGEMVSDARQRILHVIKKLTKKHKEGVIGLVVPEPLASVVCSALRSEAVSDLWKGAVGGTWESITFTPAVTVASS